MRLMLKAIAVFIAITAGPGMLIAKKEKASGAQESKNPGSKRVATVDGVPITETQARMEGAAELDSLELQVMKSKALAARNEHEILEKALERIIEAKLLQSEAEKRGISKEELLAKEVQQKIKEPADEEVDAFYAEDKQRISKPKEAVAPRIREFLKRQQANVLREELFSKLEKEHPVARLLEPLRYNVGVEDRPSMGPASAPVLLVAFSDFQCPYCKQFSETLKEVMKQYKDKVHLVFRQFPLTEIHPNARKAAEASLCADAQGHFWEMHDLLFQSQSNLRDEDLKSRAGKLGLDTAAFNKCLDSARFGSRVYEDLRAGAGAGVEGTPALFINGRFLYGSRSYEEVASTIDEELKAKKETPPTK
jgi:predicted DsbA family dithiol-disulfide isomerase